MEQPHEILGVDCDTDIEAIKRAYLKLAKKAHPDTGGSKEDFIRLHAAYQALIDGYTVPEPLVRASETPARSAKWKSYEDIMEEVRRRLDRDDGRPLADRHGQSRSTHEIWWAVGLTLICAGAVATWASYDGQSWDHSLWSFSFAISLVVLVYVGLLAAVVGTTPVTNGLTVYRWLIVLALIGVALPLFQRPRDTLPRRQHDPVFSCDIVPDWWPIHPDRSRWTTGRDSQSS